MPPSVRAATRTWDGGGANTLWNNPQNWSADTLPVAGDTVIFDGTSVKDATINVAVTVAIVQVNAGYTGTITQSPGVALTVTSSWTQSSGAFIGGTSGITIAAFTVNSGGLFTSTTGTLTVTGAVTLGAGVFTHNGGSVVFSVNNVAVNLGGAATFNHVQFLSGTKTISAGNTMTVQGTLTLTGGTIDTGTVAALGAVQVGAGFTGGGTATLLVSGTADQTITGAHTVTVGALPNLDVTKPSGALTIAGTLRTGRSWTVTAVPGGLTTTGSTVVFAGNLTITGSHTLNTVEFRGGTVVVAGGTTVTVTGTTELVSGTLNQSAASGIVAAHGAVNARVGFTGGGTATLLLNGAGNQVFDGDHTVTTGALPNVEINKPSGALTLTDTLRTGRNWTVTAAPGGLTVTGTTLVFAGNLTIAGSHTLNHVDIRSGTVVIAAGTTVTAAGNLNLFAGALNQAAATGIVAVHGSVDAQIGFTGGGTATVLVNGTTDQVITGFQTVATGSLPNLEISKPSGAVTIAGTLRTGRNWTVTSAPGGLTATGSTVVYAGNLTITGSHTLNNVDIRSGTVVIAAGTTLSVPGTTELFAGALNQSGPTGLLAAQGNVNARVGFTGSGTATLLLNGAGDQVVDGDHTATTGSLPNVEIAKPSGAVTLTDTLRTGRNWTVTSVPGGLTTTGSTLVFAGNLTITGSHTLNQVDFRSGTMVIAAGTILTTAGTATFTDGDLNGGTLEAHGDLAQAGTFDGETATIRITGTADQTFTGTATSTTGDLPAVVIDKPSGTLHLAGTIRTNTVGWTWLGGTVDPGTSTLVFNASTITGDQALANVEFQGGATTITPGTTLTATGATTLTDGDLNGGTLVVLGSLAQAGTFDGETATIRIAGMTDQTFTGTATSTTGDLPHLVIDKPGGTLHLVGTIRTNTVGWTWLQGTVDPGTSTVVFNASTITGSQALHHVELQGGVTTITAGDTLTAAGTTTLTDGDLNGGTLEAHGDVSILGTFDGETGTLRIAGAGDQTLTGTATTTTGDMANVVIDKPGGTLHLVGTVRLSTAAWSWVAGAVDPGSSVLVLDATTTLAGSHTLHDVVLRGSGHTIGSGMPIVGGTLTLEDGTVDGGILGAAGAVDQLPGFDGGSGTLVFTGSGAQVFTGTATLTAGDLPNVLIAKSDGALTLAGTLRLNGAGWTHAGGLVDPTTSHVVFAGTSSIAAAGMDFADLSVNGGTTSLVQDLLVSGHLHVRSGTLQGGGHTASVGGDVTVDGSVAAGTLSLTLNGGAPQALGGGAAAIGLDDLRVTNASGAATSTAVNVAGTLTLLGPFDISGDALGIANPIAGTGSNLTGDGTSALAITGTAPGIVIPASLPSLATLSLDNASGATLEGPLSIGQTLTLADGILGVRPWTVTVNPAGSVARTNGHVDGALAKTVPLGAAVTVDFEVGDATRYAPVSVTFPMVLWSSTLMVETAGAEHPDLASFVISPSLDVNRWWRIENGGVLFDGADVTLTWSPADVDPGADPATFVVGKWDGGWTLPATTAATPTSITAVGLSSFSEFVVGGLENGELPDTAGFETGGGPGPDVLLRAGLVTALVIALVAVVVVLRRISARPTRRARR